MAEPWGNVISGPMPSVAEQAIDFVVTPDLEYPQPLTVSFDRVQYHGGNSELKAELVYRCGTGNTRRVRCDWRGMATVTASQLTVRGVSALFSLQAAYSKGAESAKHSAFVCIGAIPHKRPIYSGMWGGNAANGGLYLTPVGVHQTSPPGDEAGTYDVPPLAERLRFRVMKSLDGLVTEEECFGEILAAGGATLQLAKLSSTYIFHSEPLRLEHLTDGFELGNADSVILTVPAAMSPAAVALVPEWELAL